jgi:hypothetical protein
MTLRTPLGHTLRDGAPPDHPPARHDACRTPADVDSTVAAIPWDLSPAERQDVSEVRAMLTRRER